MDGRDGCELGSLRAARPEPREADLPICSMPKDGGTLFGVPVV